MINRAKFHICTQRAALQERKRSRLPILGRDSVVQSVALIIFFVLLLLYFDGKNLAEQDGGEGQSLAAFRFLHQRDV